MTSPIRHPGLRPTPIGPTYDCGDFPKIFARTLALADYDRFAERRAQAARLGRLRGIGMACYVESSGVAPSRFAGALGARVGFYEAASIRVESDGAVRAMLGTHNHGQGHATTFAQILSSRFGLPIEKIEVIEGDTDLVPHGTGTFGSRSIAVGGCAIASFIRTRSPSPETGDARGIPVPDSETPPDEVVEGYELVLRAEAAFPDHLAGS